MREELGEGGVKRQQRKHALTEQYGDLAAMATPQVGTCLVEQGTADKTNQRQTTHVIRNNLPQTSSSRRSGKDMKMTESVPMAAVA